MKKIILTISVIVFSITIFAKTAPNDVIENARAVVAYEILSHCIANSDLIDSADIADFKAIEPMSIRDIYEKAPKIADLYKGVLQDVEQLSKGDFENSAELISYFADSVFVVGQSNPIKNLAAKPEMTKVSRKIKEKLSNLSYIQDFDKPEQEIPVEKMSRNKEPGGIIDYIGYILAIVLALIAAFFFLQKENTQKKAKKLAKDLKAKEIEITDLKRNTIELKRQISALQSQLRSKENEIEEFHYSQSNSQRSSTPYTSPITQQQVFTQHDNEPVISEQTIFLSAPYGGVFSETYESMEEGVTLYRLRTSDGYKGEFEFVDSEVNVERASEDPTDNVEVACMIRSQSALWRQITTIEKGAAVKDANGWKIIKKAVVTIM